MTSVIADTLSALAVFRLVIFALWLPSKKKTKVPEAFAAFTAPFPPSSPSPTLTPCLQDCEHAAAEGELDSRGERHRSPTAGPAGGVGRSPAGPGQHHIILTSAGPDIAAAQPHTSVQSHGGGQRGHRLSGTDGIWLDLIKGHWKWARVPNPSVSKTPCLVLTFRQQQG